MKDKQPTDKEIEDALPIPSGHKLLVALPDMEQTFGDTGIIKASSTMQAEQITSVIALVLDMGPEAYKDESRFPSGPWCKNGDYVLMRPYQGTRFKVFGREYRIVNDDSIDGVVKNPEGYSRV